MKFSELRLKGSYLITLEPLSDERGAFTRQFCKKEFANFGLKFEICQCNISENYKKNTLRGLHFRNGIHTESKLVSCIRGKIFDVIVDLRKDSETYLQWESIELEEKDNKVLYIPSEFAHGFQTLVDDTIVYYQMGDYFAPGNYDGLRWNDPKIGIKWPECDCRIINERDDLYKLL